MKYKLQGKKIAVLGFGLEGKDLVNFLIKQKTKVTIFDQKPENELDLSEIDKRMVDVICGPEYLSEGFSTYDIIYRSPGVYRYLIQLNEAQKKGIKISSATKLFLELCPAKIIGVTGTKGKGTTATLIYKILKATGKDVYLAGNIGKPYLTLLSKLTSNSWVVLELSSFQLIDIEKSPTIAVVLNITEDHLDWHKSQVEYINSKKNIVKYQSKDDFAVINGEYEIPNSFAKETKAKVTFFSKEKLEGKYKKYLLLRGKHNLENIAAAVSVAKLLKIDEVTIKRVVSSFKGLEHRLELVGKVDGVTFYNDSFATGPQPTMAAVASFSEPVTLILGGSDKGLSYDEMAKYLSKKKNVKSIVLIGEIAKRIKKSFKRVAFKGKIIDLGRPTMRDIVKTAFDETVKGGVVLLSPASASFDMFKDYKDRGNQFKEAVKSLS